MTSFLFKGSQVLIDIVALICAYSLAYTLRFGLELEHQNLKFLFFTLPYVVLLQYIMMAAFRVPRFAWRYVNLRDAQWVVTALASAAAVLATVRALGPAFGGYGRFVMVPYGVILMNFIISVAGILGVRSLRRVVAESKERRRRKNTGVTRLPTVLVGAGQAGILVAKELAARPDLGIAPIGFVDDNPLKKNERVHGLKVHGPVSSIGEVAKRFRCRHALITIANASGADIRRITRLCREAELHIKIIPGIGEIVGGQLNLREIRDVAIDDLLGREAIELENDAIAGVVRDRCVLVSGAGGSIGSEIARQVGRFAPKRLLLFEKSENALFEIHRELTATFPDLDVQPLLGDVCDAHRVNQCLTHHSPHVIFHAAAHKHVPLIEANPGEAIKNNVVGTRVIADAAERHGVREFVMISTDKAVNPSSVMGASKRVAEMYIQGLSQKARTKFVAVRFGNVLGSAGSVVPIFKEQIARGGPVTVTDPEMRRYFMTIPEASQLVLQAASMGHGGEIFVLDMGEPVKIVDLAADLIALSGLRAGVDIDIEFTGVRPGEKLFEELVCDTEAASKTRHPKILIGKIAAQDFDQVALGIERLSGLAQNDDGAGVRRALNQLVPEYRAPAPVRQRPRRMAQTRAESPAIMAR